VLQKIISPPLMIESCYWKEELARIAKSLRPVRNPPRWTERLHCVVERDLMVGFFMLRRLIELNKVSSAVKDFRMTVFSCPNSGKPVTLLNRGDVDELYHMDKERKEIKKPLYLSNQFIHAYLSFLARDETRNWRSIYIVSDFDRNNCIWRIPTAVVQELFLLASQDYPHSASYVFDAKKGDYTISVS
jgi:hypothetical protein